MLQCCVRLSSVMYVLWLNGVLQQNTNDKPWAVVYEKSIGTEINDLDLF